MTVAVIYCWPQVKPQIYYPLARRFAGTWRQCPPGKHPFTLYVFGNAGRVEGMAQKVFDGIPCQFGMHNNFGWDVGLYQHAAEKVPADLMVFLGAPVHFHRPGWLDRMIETYEENGGGLFGTTCYGGSIVHVRTTAFWCAPQLLNSYPDRIGSSRASRYEFEHGNHSFTRHALRSGFPCVMVTWTGSYAFEYWENHTPDAETILVRDQHIFKR